MAAGMREYEVGNDAVQQRGMPPAPRRSIKAALSILMLSDCGAMSSGESFA